MTAVLHVAGDVTEPSAEIYTVTPAVAKRWLSRNVRNRAIRPTIVEGYARDMKSGGWQITGEAIKFDTNGALADGQHRLTAVIKANVAVQMLIVRGIAPEAQGVMDSGAKRSAADALTLEGTKFSSIIAAAARLALRTPTAGFVREKVAAPTNTEIATFVEDNPEIHRAAEMASHFYPAFDAPPSVLAICWMRFSAIDVEAAGLFFAAVADMNTDGAGDPRLALIRRLASARRNKERLEPSAYLSLIFRAWNAWRRKRPVGKLTADAKAPERLA